MWETPLPDAAKKISEIIAHAVEAERASIWLMNHTRSCIEQLDLFTVSTQQHQSGQRLLRSDYPKYFSALDFHRIINAGNAHSDPCTAEFSRHYLTPLNISSLLDGTIRVGGRVAGVICLEHIGPTRQWTEAEAQFAVSVADLFSQLIVRQETLRAKQRLDAVNAMQSAILNSANYTIISTDRNGIILTANAAAERMTGYSERELIGISTPELFHDQQEMITRAQQLSQELGYKIEPGFEVFVAKARSGIADERRWTFVRKDKSRLTVALSVTAIFDSRGEVEGFVGIAADTSATDALLLNDSRYKALIESAGDGIMITEGDIFVDCNSATLKIFACDRKQFIGQPPYLFSPEFQPDGRSSKESALEKIYAALEGTTQIFEWTHTRLDGSLFPAEVTLNKINDDSNTRLMAIVRDVSGRKKAEQQLELNSKEILQQNRNLQSIFQLSRSLSGLKDNQKIAAAAIASIEQLNSECRPTIALINKNIGSFFPPISTAGEASLIEISDCAHVRELFAVAETLEPEPIFITHSVNMDVKWTQIATAIGKRYPLNSLVFLPLVYGQQFLGFILICFDKKKTFSQGDRETFVSMSKTVAMAIANAWSFADITFRANHDALTQLANRTFLHIRFNTWLNNSEEYPEAAMMLIDLNRFKEINDALGHHTGDILLKIIAKKLTEIFQDHKNVLVARLGGDEFALLLLGSQEKRDKDFYALKVLEALADPIVIEELEMQLTASIGFSTFPEHGNNSHDLLRAADVAMYSAKKQGKSIAVYDPEHDSNTLERLQLITDLNNAIDNKQLVLHYQPKVEVESQQIIGFEALVRWQHPTQGLIYPDRFIPFAEVTDLVVSLTDTVLEMALAQQAGWKELGMNYSVAVNLSARNLIGSHLYKRLESLLKKYQTKPGELELEITETSLMIDPEHAEKLLQDISALGVKISIDDFGTGYSSLSYLRRLPIEALKIDRVFVTHLCNNPQDEVIVRSTIGLAHNLGLEVVAEGVEDQRTVELLTSLGCNQMQGYYLSRPLPWEKIEFSLKNNSFIHWSQNT